MARANTASASYWLCLLNPLVMLAATYKIAATPAVAHGPNRSLSLIWIGDAAGTGPDNGLIVPVVVTGPGPLYKESEKVAKLPGWVAVRGNETVLDLGVPGP